ncbi:hypothetical protein PHYSODRAFT_341659 [Phytophthora sojae]|uniref:Uncharacterized protein n=1 Tax=Phytophthora sojae (strain P6497) TaxID=1094619 RepID=G5ADZ5_PHYSP|nr:hypothetical protein PHYSODRAFT_341659 [Phytophthora sojae]EGZ06397.1 hypothetical protein PHYSODRAFT_341659 [Phytophthora sojae]|eukprot:XP_009538294.1 hypothetical protein PHYSODRAFT_341659 [Phytophthora sojae]
MAQVELSTASAVEIFSLGDDNMNKRQVKSSFDKILAKYNVVEGALYALVALVFFYDLLATATESKQLLYVVKNSSAGVPNEMRLPTIIEVIANDYWNEVSFP